MGKCYPPFSASPLLPVSLTSRRRRPRIHQCPRHGGEQVDEIESYHDLRVVTLADPDGNTFELVEVPE